MTGTVMVSYTRARAENTIPRCKVGFLERPERVVLVIIGALFNRMAQVLWVIAIFSNITVISRMLYTGEAASASLSRQQIRSAVRGGAGTSRSASADTQRQRRTTTSKFRARSSQNQTPVFDALRADQRIGDFLHILCLTLDHQHFEAIVVIEVDVHGRKNILVMVVLHVRQFFVQHAHVVVVNQCHFAPQRPLPGSTTTSTPKLRGSYPGTLRSGSHIRVLQSVRRTLPTVGNRSQPRSVRDHSWVHITVTATFRYPIARSEQRCYR